MLGDNPQRISILRGTMASLSQKEIEDAVLAKNNGSAVKDLVKSYVKKTIRQKKQKRNLAAIVKDNLSKPIEEKTYTVILADCPWRYDFAETDNRKIENQYPTMDFNA